jgi:hypothetical protein
LKLGATTLGANTTTEPLVTHNATLQLGDRVLRLSFNQLKQSWLDVLRFEDGSTFKEISYGKGRIFLAAYPVELAEGTDAAAALYSYVAAKVGIAPLFEIATPDMATPEKATPISPGVLIYPIVLEDSVLYVMESESADDADIDLRDKLTGTHITLRLPAQHAALALVAKQSKTVIAKYGY